MSIEDVEQRFGALPLRSVPGIDPSEPFWFRFRAWASTNMPES